MTVTARQFYHEPSLYRGGHYLLDPDDQVLGDEYEQMHALDRRAQVIDNWRIALLVAVAVFMFVSLAVGNVSELAAWLTFAFSCAVNIAVFAVLSAARRRKLDASNELCAKWIESGAAAPKGPLDEFVIGDVDDTTRFKAACILRDAMVTEGRLEWAEQAREQHRLATGAEVALTEVTDIHAAMVQHVADMLDPHGEETVTMLRHDIWEPSRPEAGHAARWRRAWKDS